MKIEKGIPVPPIRRDRRHWADIAEKMAAGDSVSFDSKNPAISMRNAIVKAGSRAVMRKQSDGTMRVWKAGKEGA